jgi:hypothetical protein
MEACMARPMSRWVAALRVVLGVLQMVGAAASFLLLMRTGLSLAAICTAIGTLMLTVASLIVFRKHDA